MSVGRYLDFPFDKEVFNYSWKNTPDLFLDNILASGAVQRDSEIARLIANGSNSYVVPYYNNLGGDEQLYDGVTDFTYDSITGGHYKGVVYGRMKAWDAISFIKDFNSGADPMQQIVSGVADYWQKKRQERFVGILSALFGIDNDPDFALHSKCIAKKGNEQVLEATVTSGATATKEITVKLTSKYLEGGKKEVAVNVTDQDTVAVIAGAIKTALNNDTKINTVFTADNDGAKVTITKDELDSFDYGMKFELVNANGSGVTIGASSDGTTHPDVDEKNVVGITSLGDLMVQANGDNAQDYSLIIAHSKVAQDLNNLQLLNFSKFTDERGITRELPIGTVAGKTLIVNDSVPVKDSAIKGQKEYTTFLLGDGAVKFEEAPVDIPVEMDRNPEVKGGKDMIYTRLRETFAPYGFSFTADVSTAQNIAVPDSILLDPDNWERKIDAKAVLMARIITN